MAEIKQLWVDEDHRGCGVARGLLKAAFAEASDRCCQSIWALSYDFRHRDFMRNAVSIASLN